MQPLYAEIATVLANNLSATLMSHLMLNVRQASVASTRRSSRSLSTTKRSLGGGNFNYDPEFAFTSHITMGSHELDEMAGGYTMED